MPFLNVCNLAAQALCERFALLPAGDLVDVKVCAVDSTWSGLKLMVRRNKR